ncbi:cell division protein FtsQ/DivIB [Ramlibacter tataouinensis]|uniref:Cell division protein FtsQ n=1 Tax=Ramlibacter tataouinensis (strain ATCC BAA-407 / DSM 14655 / LMG 21543 / TTB310) TaxID=365046 RepID=F5XZM8_RAMTT|nr:cell division protein FtsQ/DivIB [Ramlibacter tataouinensis]AEG92057.1 Candidate cell division protein (division cell wall cluster) [Ramlibacter tataouinensis TTB310]
MKASAALTLPADVRLMNITATVLFAACGVLLLAALAWWLVRHPAFALGRITVQGDVAHNSPATLRANVAPRMAGNFFTVDLVAVRQAFEAAPWVRQAVVRREFPNRLRVLLQEHRPVALWGTEGESALVNSHGEVFEADPGDIEPEGLPRLAGPDGQAAQVLAMYRALAPLFQPLGLELVQLVLTSRGSWQATMDTGASVELGRGPVQEVAARTRRFAQTLAQAASKLGRRPEALVSADLRHGDGYAIRLRGVTTATGAEAQKKK